MTDWREPRPITEDDRLVYLPHLVGHYRNLMIEADFNGESTYEGYKQLYEHYNALVSAGHLYEPTF